MPSCVKAPARAARSEAGSVPLGLSLQEGRGAAAGQTCKHWVGDVMGRMFACSLQRLLGPVDNDLFQPF